MASKRWDLSSSYKDKSGKWRSTKVGVVFEGDKGQLQIRIDPGVSLSTPEGVLLTGWPPKDKDDRRQTQSSGGGNDGYDQGGGDDQIPF